MAINGYVRDFFKHLREVAEHREDFEYFYPLWNSKRNETIESLEELLKTLEGVEFYCDVGIASTSALAAGSALSTLIGFVASRAINPTSVLVSSGAHALKAGISAAKATEISRARCKASNLIQIDYDETENFVQMGLRFDGIFREMRKIVENIRRMTLTHTMDQLMEALGETFPDMRGGNAAAPHRELVQAIMDGADIVARVDADNISAILNTYFQNNPDMQTAFVASVQAGYDLVGLTGLMNVSIIGDIGFDCLYAAGSMKSMKQDLYDCAYAIERLCTGGSVTQDLVKRIIKRLKDEQKYLAQVYNRLRNR